MNIIGAGAFEGCVSLHSIDIPDSVTTIEYTAFASCGSLASVSIPTSVKSIGERAFENCVSLNSVSIPASVTEIEYGTFMDCMGLAEVTIPKSVKRISERAFYECPSIADVYYNSTVADWSAVEVERYNNDLLFANFHFMEEPVHKHEWSEPVFDWAHDYVSCTATFTCSGCGESSSVECEISSTEEVFFLATAYFHDREYTDEAEFYLDLPAYEYTIDSEKDVRIECSIPLKYFVSVEMDGKLVPEEYYTVTEGSTVLTFDSAYLDTLAVGTHDVRLNFTINGRNCPVDTTLTIRDKSTATPAPSATPSATKTSTSSEKSPKTGDESNIALWMIVFAGCFVAITCTGTRAAKKGKRQE